MKLAQKLWWRAFNDERDSRTLRCIARKQKQGDAKCFELTSRTFQTVRGMQARELYEELRADLGRQLWVSSMF